MVGGLPHVEWTDELCHKHADFCFELPTTSMRPVHFLCDDVASPMSRTLEYVAAKTIQSASLRPSRLEPQRRRFRAIPTRMRSRSST